MNINILGKARTQMIFDVTLRFQHPASDEADGIVFEVAANNKRGAISLARRQAARDGRTPSVGKGWIAFTAVKRIVAFPSLTEL